MAQNDIYNSKSQWESVVNKIDDGTYLSAVKVKNKHPIKYYIKNKDNIRHFKKLIKKLEFKNLSYIKRIQMIKALRRVAFLTNKKFEDVNREDVEEIVTEMNKVLKTINTRREFVNLNKANWKIILPELDYQGRPDDSIIPYAWRIKVNADKSLQKDREDKITDTEYMKIMKSMNKNPMYQLWFSMIYTNLARPQELAFINTDKIEIKDNYARVRISEHGKEGTKTLQLVDNYYYLVNWLRQHPFYKKGEKGIPLFINQSNNRKTLRIHPRSANQYLQQKLKELHIDIKLSNYSFKRNGVTHRYIHGNSAQSIQKIAGWSSTRQLKTYDLSEQEEFLEQELIEKGIIKDKEKQKKVSYKVCAFCNAIAPITAERCPACQRSLDRKEILKEEENKNKEIKDLKKTMATVLAKLESLDNLKTAKKIKQRMGK